MKPSVAIVCGLLHVACGDSEGESETTTGGGGSGGGNVVAACHTGEDADHGCSEVPLPANAVQAFKDECEEAGSVASDTCPAGADAKCTPTPGVIGPLTPVALYWYGLVDQGDLDDTMATCDGLEGVWEEL